MVERKGPCRRSPERPALQALLERAKSVTLTDEESFEQRVSFVYGNAPKGARITKESAREAVRRLRLVPTRS